MKKFTLLILCLAFMSLNLLRAQVAPEIEWEKSFGGGSNDFAYCIQQIIDDGFIIAGYSASTDGDVTGNQGSYDFWLTRLDSQGNLVWEKSLGGSDGESAFSIEPTSDAGFIVAGNSYSNDGDVSGNHGHTDYWIAKLSSSGGIVWQKSFGGSNSDRANSIQQSADGGYIVTGYAWSDDGDVTGFHGVHDAWILKLSSNGDILWKKCFGGSSGDVGNSIQEISGGGFIMAGYSESNDGDVSGNHGNVDAWILKLDANGNLLWQKSIGGSNDDRANFIRQTSDNGFVVAGYSYSADGDLSANHGDADFWIMKLNENGNLIWQKSLGGSGTDAAYCIRETMSGNFIATGYTSSNDGDVTGNHGSNDYWVVKLDAGGNMKWEKSLGGNGDDQSFSLVQIEDGNYVVVGWSYSSDGDVTGNHGSADYWLVKLQNEESTFVQPSNPNSSFSVFPNPTNGNFQIKLSKLLTEPGILYITNYLGQKLFHRSIADGTLSLEIDCFAFLPGWYSIQIQSNNDVMRAGLIVE